MSTSRYKARPRSYLISRFITLKSIKQPQTTRTELYAEVRLNGFHYSPTWLKKSNMALLRRFTKLSSRMKAVEMATPSERDLAS